MKFFPTLKTEKVFWKQGYHEVIGVDEVGRGCLAGPVVAAATVFDRKHRRIPGVTDSKQLTFKQREQLYPLLKTKAKLFGIGIASVNEINTLGINPSIFLAMERAILQLKLELISRCIILVDGKVLPTFEKIIPNRIETIIKGDQLAYSISAASILAKVYRDQLMGNLGKLYPHYQWDKNVGYGTQEHRDGISQKGLCEHHRTLFCRNAMATLHNHSM